MPSELRCRCVTARWSLHSLGVCQGCVWGICEQGGKIEPKSWGSQGTEGKWALLSKLILGEWSEGHCYVSVVFDHEGIISWLGVAWTDPMASRNTEHVPAWRWLRDGCVAGVGRVVGRWTHFVLQLFSVWQAFIFKSHSTLLAASTSHPRRVDWASTWDVSPLPCNLA